MRVREEVVSKEGGGARWFTTAHTERTENKVERASPKKREENIFFGVDKSYQVAGNNGTEKEVECVSGGWSQAAEVPAGACPQLVAPLVCFSIWFKSRWRQLSNRMFSWSKLPSCCAYNLQLSSL